MIEPSVEFLRECFSYDPDTGVLMRKARPRHHFIHLRCWLSANMRAAGKPAGFPNGNGYLRASLSIDGKSWRFYVHRVIWCLQTGEWPSALVDHEDRDRGNNRWKNLRVASAAQNTSNSVARNTSILGVKGVSRKRSRFCARISQGEKCFYLGTFDTVEEASAAYKAAAKRLQGEFHRT